VSPKSKGFTLLELVIAITILAFISMFTVQAIQTAFRTKAKVQGDIDKTATLRDALRIIERDINMAYNYHDSYIELYNMTQKLRQKNAQTPNANNQLGNQNTAFGQPPASNAATDPTKYKLLPEKIYTQFIGEAESLDLTTISNVRMMEDSPISSQAEVGYRLKPCRKRSTQQNSSNCLWRRVANYLHDDITRDGQETVLLENVTKFKLRYLGPGRADGEWVDSWITTERGDDLTKNHFPWAVEVTLEVKDSSDKVKDKALRMTMVAALRNPNNPDPKDTKDPANALINPASNDPAAAQQAEIQQMQGQQLQQYEQQQQGQGQQQALPSAAPKLPGTF
jgi:prepilin-type N-terminal cleavage/methylation domain-containing protein